MEMLAALAFEQGGALHLRSVELASPGPDEIRIRLVASGICHTDLTVLDTAPLPWPAVLGHEGAGIVEAVGSDVEDVAIGDHVIATTDSCGHCAMCEADYPGTCLKFSALNMNGGRRADGTCTHLLDGASVFGAFLGQSSFATHALVARRAIVVVDRELPLDLLASLGCGVQTGAGAVLNTLRPGAGKGIVVFGAGAVGLSAVMAARIAGCAPIIVVDRVTSRLETALEIGATVVVDATSGDVGEAIRALQPQGVPYAVEATGVTQVMAIVADVLAVGGTGIFVGVAPSGKRFDVASASVISKVLTLRGSKMGGDGGVPQIFIPKLIDYWRQGLLPIERITRFFAFQDINEAIAAARDGSAIKPMLRMPGI